jgi:hypothetical protein
VIPVAVFMLAVVFHIDLPGLYMDAVNPDFLAAQKLHPHLHNPSATLPSKIFPILGNLYHGVQNFYVALPMLAIFGFHIATIRIAQALFGALLVAAFFIVARRLTQSTLLAIFGALGLATEIAFTASFRTQFYIVMGGATWLFVSLMLALPATPETELSDRRAFWSGFFSGLAGYGYFVLLFFVPGTLAWIALRPTASARTSLRWMIGFMFGLTPFALGYLSLLLKLHGIGPTMQLMRSLLGVLQPFENSGASHGNVLYAWQMAHLAITNDGNNLVIFGQTTSSWVSEPKFYLFALCTLLMSIGSVACLALRRRAPAWVLIGFLPLSFLLVASLFGHRLWAHHFSVLVPFVYLLPLPLLARILDMTKAGQRPQMAIVAVACFACLAGNMSQQYAFHAALGRSGGEGKATSALNQLALEARGSSSNVAYVFPEWGFFTSFCLLTENKVRYVVDVAPETLSELRHAGYDDLRLVYWQPAERERYMQVLQQAGLNTITTRTFTTLDGRPVFYWLEGHPASP